MLPQRRKTAEEIAKLRETLGIPDEAGGEATAEAPPASSPSDPSAPAAIPRAAEPEDEPPTAPPPAKPVRSLRRSEREPVVRLAPTAAAKVPTESALPTRRHNDRELLEMRRIQAAPPEQSISHVKHMAAPWPLIVLAYLLPIGGGILKFLSSWLPRIPEPNFPSLAWAEFSRAPWIPRGGEVAVAIGCISGLLLAGFIAWRKPRSRHHAGFILLLAVLLLAFGFIQYLDPNHGP